MLSYLVERVGTGIRTLCEGLVNYLPHLWDASADHNMLRCAILTTLVVVVQVRRLRVAPQTAFGFDLINSASVVSSKSYSFFLLFFRALALPVKPSLLLCFVLLSYQLIREMMRVFISWKKD